jgi:hypothetical protein
VFSLSLPSVTPRTPQGCAASYLGTPIHLNSDK